MGEVSGLCARGGFEVGLKWENGTLREASIYSRNGKTCRIRTSLPLKVKCEGKAVRCARPEKGILEFKTVQGQTYLLSAGK
jgi:alpha-L-fucosidase 2